MSIFYPATVYASAIVYLLIAALLFLRRHEGERSRVILACFVMFSVLNCSNRFINLLEGEVPALVVSVPMLLLGLVMVISYILYPIEVVSPGWLKWRRLALLYSPVLGLGALWMLTVWAGVEYKPYGSLREMLPEALQFDVSFRLLLSLLIFAPLAIVFFIPYTRRYNNTDRVWMRKYAAAFTINCTAYLVVVFFSHPVVNVCYYYVSVGCSLYVAYLELFVRLIRSSESSVEATAGDTENVRMDDMLLATEPDVVESKNAAIFERFRAYVHEEHAWRDPDLTMEQIVERIYTNRTTLSLAIQEQGYDNYTAYINSLRINEFISIIHSKPTENFQNAFFDVGYRSRTTAHRNFRQITGMTPTEYFRGVHME